jgi:NAD(P)-dependent dehydrogenase (short-subunit alcohol dehydrogenase family)
MRLLNKTVLVTGASKGIGRAIALGMGGEDGFAGLLDGQFRADDTD